MRKLDAWRQVFDSPLSRDEKLVWFAIIDHTDEHGWSWPGIQRIAERCGMSESSVRRALKTIEQKTIRGLRVERSNGRRSNRYQVSTPIVVRSEPTSEPCQRDRVTSSKPGQADTVEPCQGDSVEAPQPCQGDSVQPYQADSVEEVQPCQADNQPCQADHSNPVRLNAEVGHRSDPRKQIGAPKRTSPPRSASGRRWRRVPSGWEPNAEHRTLARDLGVDLLLEVQQFRDHEFAAPKSDPDATFRNWLRRAARAPPGGHRSRTPVQPNYGAIIQYERIE